MSTEKVLHITNGESVQLRDAGVPGDVLFFADVLHEGPVPSRLSFDELSEVRGRFFQEIDWGPPDTFAERDATLHAFSMHEEVVLWYEHDLFDQLLLIQLVDWFGRQELGSTKLTLIDSDDYLGPMPSERLASMFPSRRPISQQQIALAAAAWKAFRSPDPTEIEKLLMAGTAALPHLEAALGRHLEQFPSVRKGLSRTEKQILELASDGIHDPNQLFAASQKCEEAIFMGDATFFRYVGMLQSGRHPLLDENCFVTRAGADVFAGVKDAIRLNGINRWLGGVHLDGDEAEWRWNEDRRKLERRA
jgi:Domain of unknown function (DUF1835)